MANQVKSTLLKKLDRLRPCDYRLLARINRKGLSTKELWQRSSLSFGLIGKISRLKSWENVRVGDAGLFMDACAISPFRLAKQIEFIKRAVSKKRTTRPFMHTRVFNLDCPPNVKKFFEQFDLLKFKKVLMEAKQK